MIYHRVKVYNPHDGWMGTKCYIDNHEINARSLDFHVGVDEFPTFTFKTVGAPDIDMSGEVKFDFTPETVQQAAHVLVNELSKHDDLFDGFAASIAAALKEHGYCGLPFEPEEEMARKVLDFLIGEG